MTDRTVLVADDDPRLVQAIKSRLESAGFEVETAQDAYQAVALTRRVKPAILVLDINMPAGNGFTVHERLKKLSDVRDTPVIYVTGEDPLQVDKLARDMDAYGVLHKPFYVSDLVVMIMEATASSSVEAS
ncbi:MAG: hypothetical protein Phyf2KO_11270 [Phycisphaerales bacterium]